MSTIRRTSAAQAYSLARTASALLACAGLAQTSLAQAQDQSDAARAGRNRASSAAPAQPATQPTTPTTPPGAVRPGTAATPPVTTTAQPSTRPTTTLPKPRPHTDDAATPEPAEDEVVLSEFIDPIDLRTLVDYVAGTLRINVSGSDSLQGSVVLNAPVVVKRDQLLSLLDSLLETQNFTIVRDDKTGWYKVLPLTDVTAAFKGELATTRLVPTPGVKPSTLAEAVNTQLGAAGRTGRLSYLDDLGVILITDSPRRIDALVQLVDTVIERASQQQFLRFELKHVSASIARSRLLELVGYTLGSSGTAVGQPGQPGTTPSFGGSGVTGNLSNLSEKLVVDSSGNALFFRGYPEEGVRIKELLALIDRPNELQYKRYFAGTSATQIAQLAEKKGLGAVDIIDTTPTTTTTTPNQPNAPRQAQPANQLAQLNQALQGLGQSTSSGGPTMVVDAGKGYIIYYATPAQQQQLADLIAVFDTTQDLVVIREYAIKNRAANDIADVLIGIVSGQAGTDTSNPFTGNAFQNQFNRNFGNQNNNNNNRTNTNNRGTTGTTNRNTGANTRNQQGAGIGRTGGGRGLPSGSDINSELGGQDVYIIADQGKNQVLVRAPIKQQEEFAKLINKLDQRRPQVYLDVQIVSVSATDDFRLAFENQLINAGGSGGALNTNFGLGSLTSTTGTGGTAATTGGFTSRKNVATGLSGITGAIIRNDQVPIVMNALKTNSDTRILSSPQLLVDDNEQASIQSVDQQPTSTTTQTTGNPTQTAFAGYEQAGTELHVTPSISEGGYLRLQYEITLSNFVGTGANGLPPPKQERQVSSDSVTLPSDFTVIVGGITVDSKSSTYSRVPLLGDIPIIGRLFGDTSKSGASTRLYVFITPRILRDQNFRDLLLLTRGPQADAKLAQEVPEIKPAIIDLVETKASSVTPASEPSVPPPAAPPAPPARELAPKPTPPAPSGTVRRREQGHD